MLKLIQKILGAEGSRQRQLFHKALGSDESIQRRAIERLMGRGPAKDDVARIIDSMQYEMSKLNSSFQTQAEILSSIRADIPQSTLEKLRDKPEDICLRDKPEDICLRFSALEHGHGIHEPEFVSHSKWGSYLSGEFNKPGFRILEVGSRNVTGGDTRKLFSAAYYVGFDFYEGENVDVVGDAHKLSSYFGHDEKFDLIFSAAVFEHFHMPWIVAQEIQKLLKVGGYVFVETHFSFGAHERPWNFFQFSDMGLRALFNSALGFDLVDRGMSNPMNGVFNQKSDEYLRGKPVGDLYCHSEILCRKTRDVSEFEWNKVEIDEIVDNTRYPLPKKPVPNLDSSEN
jgi:SAM-dependent methyltransferase